MRDERGQATVELVALLPVVALLGLLGWQALIAGQAAWLSGTAARAAARASAVGADPAAAARRVLPVGLAAGLTVRHQGDGEVSLALPVPAVVAGWTVMTLHATARFAPQVG